MNKLVRRSLMLSSLAFLSFSLVPTGVANADTQTSQGLPVYTDTIPSTANGLLNPTQYAVIKNGSPDNTSLANSNGIQAFVAPGTWTTDGGAEPTSPLLSVPRDDDGNPKCSWIISDGGFPIGTLGGTVGGKTRQSGSSAGPITITILDSDFELHSMNCGAWTRIG